MVTWGEFVTAEPELAAFGAARLEQRPAYLAGVGGNGFPRVHPVTPIVGDDGLFVFMEPSSPKGHDLRDREVFALHNGVPDMNGTGGEFFVRGRALLVNDADTRAAAVQAATYEPAERYILFELSISEARCNGYGDVALPDHWRWQESEASQL